MLITYDKYILFLLFSFEVNAFKGLGNSHIQSSKCFIDSPNFFVIGDAIIKQE